MMIAALHLLLLMSHATTLTSETTLQYRSAKEQESKKLEAGQSLELQPGSQILVQSPDQIPLLVVVPNENADNVHLTGALQKDLLAQATRSFLNEATKDLLAKTQQAQSHIKARRFAEAHSLLGSSIDKYPQVGTLYFMQGTVYYLENNRREAVSSLEAGLRYDPENNDAKKLLEKLKRMQ